jgi:hypothetical protein
VLHPAAACARSAGPTVAEEVASTLIQEWKGASVLFLVDYFELRSLSEDSAKLVANPLEWTRAAAAVGTNRATSDGCSSLRLIGGEPRLAPTYKGWLRAPVCIDEQVLPLLLSACGGV